MVERKLHSVLEDGTEIYEYPDGALRRSGGQYYKRPPQAKVYDKESALLAVESKRAIKQHRIETLQGEVRRTLKKKYKATSPEKAGAEMVGELIDVAKSGPMVRASDKLSITKYVLDAAGMKAKEAGTAPKITLEMTPEAVDRLYELSQDSRPALEGEFVDVE